MVKKEKKPFVSVKNISESYTKGRFKTQNEKAHLKLFLEDFEDMKNEKYSKEDINEFISIFKEDEDYDKEFTQIAKKYGWDSYEDLFHILFRNKSYKRLITVLLESDSMVKNAMGISPYSKEWKEPYNSKNVKKM